MQLHTIIHCFNHYSIRRVITFCVKITIWFHEHQGLFETILIMEESLKMGCYYIEHLVHSVYQVLIGANILLLYGLNTQCKLKSKENLPGSILKIYYSRTVADL